MSGGNRQLRTRVKTAKGRKISSTTWLERQLNDPYVHLAKKEGYRSRAAYKLLEIDEKFHLLVQGKNVIDLGAAPGGWTQVAVKKGCKVIGIDLQDMEPIAGAHLIKCDFMSDEAISTINNILNGKKVDIVLSDMAAASCGHRQTDHIRIVALCEAAFYFAIDNLNVDGSFVAKILRGGTENELLQNMKRNFSSVKHFKPAASRKDSAEMYVIATGFKNVDIN